jgi:hypothetical protein
LLRLDGYLGFDRHELEARAHVHDLSKFSELEQRGYIWLTWIYHCKEQGRPFEVAPQIAQLVESALAIHRSRNAHHPEAHASPNAMSTLDVVEMVCDWTAIAQEKEGQGSARAWAIANISKWSFSPAMRELVFDTIDNLDQRTAIEHGRLGY